MNLLTDITWSVVKFFKTWGNLIIEARQKQANFQIAQLLQRDEYRGHSVGAIFKALNDGTLGDLK
tara:strand:+ start:1269 stop:1463 length:195 start_codon:yes stop_codon:yes gene_type:complete